MKKQFIKKGVTGFIFGLLAIIALIMIFNKPIKNKVVATYQPKVTRQVVVAASKKETANKKHRQRFKTASYNFKKVKPLDFGTVVSSRIHSRQIAPAGQILVPQSGIHLPIGLGVSNTTLALAAGTMRPDQQMGRGNYPLAGHHMTDPKILFGPLYFKTRIGQSVYLTDMKSVYQYQVYQRVFIAADRVDVINQTKQPIVTLITCDATGKGRLMIRGRLVKTTPLKQTDSKIKRAFLRPVNS